jgi:hypothetical protein
MPSISKTSMVLAPCAVERIDSDLMIRMAGGDTFVILAGPEMAFNLCKG